MLRELFGWSVRWEGASIHGGYSAHVGSDESYVALYAKDGGTPAARSYDHIGALNHVGVLVEDLDATEARVAAAGFVPHAHADYEPGRRFYFDDADGIEWEVISYA